MHFRHLEEEELLIFIAVPLAILMFSATFLIGGNSEDSARRRPQPTRQQKQNTVDITAKGPRKKNKAKKIKKYLLRLLFDPTISLNLPLNMKKI